MFQSYLLMILMFILWIYFIELSLTRKEKGFTYLEFALSIPLMVFLANNSYLAGFIFGWIFVFVIGLTSIYVLSANLDDIRKAENYKK